MPQVTGASASPSSDALRLAQDRDELVGQRAAVRVAQDERPRAGLAGRAQRREGVVAVGRVAVEEVLGVVDASRPRSATKRTRVRDHVEVLGRRRAEDLGDVEQPALAEDRDDRRLGRDELLEVRVVARRGSRDGGSSRRPPAWRVCQVIVRAAAKNSMSLGFEPGQPPSM